MYDDVELDEGGMGKMQAGFSRKWQVWMDKAAPHSISWWVSTGVIMLLYCIRVYLINGAPRACALIAARLGHWSRSLTKSFVDGREA